MVDWYKKIGKNATCLDESEEMNLLALSNFKKLNLTFPQTFHLLCPEPRLLLYVTNGRRITNEENAQQFISEQILKSSVVLTNQTTNLHTLTVCNTV